MTPQEMIERFCSALRKDGYVLYVPQKVWQAYENHLLKERWLGKNSGMIPGRFNEKLRVFYLKEKEEETQPLSEPTFTSPNDWRMVLNHCHLLGVGGAEKTSARPYQALLRQADGSVLELMRISVVFKGPYDYDTEARFHKLWPGRQWMYSAYFTGNLIIQTDFFTKERLAKIRRRVEDRLRKGSPDDILQIARFLGLAQ